MAKTRTVATIRLRRSRSRRFDPPIPNMGGRLPGCPCSPTPSTSPQQGVQRRAGRRLPADLLQPVHVEQGPRPAPAGRRCAGAPPPGDRRTPAVRFSTSCPSTSSRPPGRSQPTARLNSAVVSASGRCRYATSTRSRLSGSAVHVVTSAVTQLTRSAPGCARPRARPTSEKSTAVTRQPRPASQSACRPSPAAGRRVPRRQAREQLGRSGLFGSADHCCRSAYRSSHSRARMRWSLSHLPGTVGP